MNPFEWHWLARSFLSLALVIPAWLSVGFFRTNFGIRGEVTMIWYFVGTVLGTAVFIRVLNLAPSIMPSIGVLLAIVAVGVVFGSGANAFLFSAIPDASNPAIPQAIQGASVVFVFIFSGLLAMFIPRYFQHVTLGLYQFIGIVLTIAGIVMLGIRR